MSIWQSIDNSDSSPEVRAIPSVTRENDIFGAGDETTWIDVAFNASWHPRLRLLLSDDATGAETKVLLSPETARVLADRLVRAAVESDLRFIERR